MAPYDIQYLRDRAIQLLAETVKCVKWEPLLCFILDANRGLWQRAKRKEVLHLIQTTLAQDLEKQLTAGRQGPDEEKALRKALTRVYERKDIQTILFSLLREIHTDDWKYVEYERTIATDDPRLTGMWDRPVIQARPQLWPARRDGPCLLTSLDEALVRCVADFLLPEDLLMLRRVDRFIRGVITQDIVMKHDAFTEGSFVAYKDAKRTTSSNFLVWGCNFGYVTSIQGNTIVINGSYRRACKNVKRVRIFPDVIAVASHKGKIRNCPGCYGVHYPSRLDGVRQGKCILDINGMKIDPFPRGYYLVNKTG